MKLKQIRIKEVLVAIKKPRPILDSCNCPDDD